MFPGFPDFQLFLGSVGTRLVLNPPIYSHLSNTSCVEHTIDNRVEGYYSVIYEHTRIEQPVTVPTLPTVSANVTTTGVASRAPAATRAASLWIDLRLMMSTSTCLVPRLHFRRPGRPPPVATLFCGSGNYSNPGTLPISLRWQVWP